jgi:hypothetical protein
MPQMITKLGPAPHKNQGTRLSRMMTARAFKYHQYIGYNLQLAEVSCSSFFCMLDDVLLILLHLSLELDNLHVCVVVRLVLIT